MEQQSISPTQQISYRITLLSATAAGRPYAGQLAAIREQVEELSIAWNLYQRGELLFIPEIHQQGLQQRD